MCVPLAVLKLWNSFAQSVALQDEFVRAESCTPVRNGEASGMQLG
jgi:hypothetical protein